MKLLKFGADWCASCKTMTKTLQTIDHQYKDALNEVNIDVNLNQVTKYGIRGVPTLILVEDDGTEVKRLVGSATKASLESFLA